MQADRVLMSVYNVCCEFLRRDSPANPTKIPRASVQVSQVILRMRMPVLIRHESDVPSPAWDGPRSRRLWCSFQ